MASSSFSCARLAAWTGAAVLLQMLGLCLFVIGFFPVKPTLSGFSGPESYGMPTCDPSVESGGRENLPPDQLRSLYREMSKIPPAFDRLILMVIDGLPAEFVLGRDNKPPTKSMMESMPYTQSLLSGRRAIAYHAKAAPPTVTMPRLKAMVSGAIGGFLDVAFNFNTQALLDDNLLAQFFRIGWKMVMLGDETWCKLFPELFTRQDRVSSFYVKDTIEVDLNVSRHLEVELAADDWNLLILHYLGLDHVGHIGGRRSILMAPKLKEMDEVIKMIHMHRIMQQESFDKRTLLLVVSDHGMTDGGNHGGSSYEETDSLALFISGGTAMSDYSPNVYSTASQVDITPTLALLFGVPIPKNNVGLLLLDVFNSLTDKQRLRALELNSWQLLRLLQAQLPGLLCGNWSHTINDGDDPRVSETLSSTEENFNYLFSKASVVHNLWQLGLQSSGFMTNNTDDLSMVVSSYYDFLRNASAWLSHRATDKPVNLLLSGVAIMLISCILLLSLSFCLFKEVYPTQKQCYLQHNECNYSWHLDGAFVLLGISIHVLSLGASSLVEEEQYTWHYLTSTLYLIFLLKTIQSFLKHPTSGLINVMEVGEEKHTIHQLRRTDISTTDRLTNHDFPQFKRMKYYYQISSVLIVLICGRILRGWHQGGVNWVDLPDISKWLEQTGDSIIKSFQIVSLIFLMMVNLFSLGVMKPKMKLVPLVIFGHLVSGFLVFLNIMENQSQTAEPTSQNSIFVAQMLYLTVTITVAVTVVTSPWSLPLQRPRTHLITRPSIDSLSFHVEMDSLFLGIRYSIYLIGVTFTASWCLLQLLLQQAINAVPILLIFFQLSTSIIYFSADQSHCRQWVEVAAMHFLGMAGHFGIGNSNSLATIDVAGAFMGISRHSTVISGILMFIITYASPMLSFLSMVVCISMTDMRDLSGANKSDLGCVLKLMIAVPCLLPLVLNSIVLTAFTIILLLMKDHLFIWSVFSPKYLYVCAATASVYLGVCIIASTGLYVCTVFFYRAKLLKIKC